MSLFIKQATFLPLLKRFEEVAFPLMSGIEINKTLPVRLKELPLLNADNQTLSLDSLIGENVTVIILLRHFACIGCSEHVTEWKKRFAEFHRLNIKLLLVGNGKPEHLEDFIARFGLDKDTTPAYTDPTLELHQMLQLKRSLMSTFGLKAVRNAARAFSNGHFQKSIQGDSLQQGGLIILDAQKQVQLIHREKAVGDHLDISSVLEQAIQYLPINNEAIL